MKNSKRTNYLLIVLGLIINLNMVFAQVPNWQWAKNVGGGGGDWSKIAVDLNGNSYLAGSFTSDSITFGNLTLTNAGGGNNFPSDMPFDFFLAKYNSSGNVIWAKSFGGNSIDEVGDIAVDVNGNIYLTGAFLSPSITLGNIILTNTNTTFTSNFFIAKFDSSGNAIWAESSGAAGGGAIVADAFGNLYVTGSFGGNAIFGSITLTSSGASDFFIVKYNSNSGNALWARSGGGSIDNDYSSAIAVDLSGNIIVTGLTLSPTITFDNITLTNNVADIFVVKYNASGTVLWARNADGDGYAYSKGISTDANGNLYLTGYVVGTSITFGNITLASVFFIVKYDASGNEIWAKAGVGAATYGISISTDASGNSFVAGHFQDNINFDSYQLINSGIVNVFLVKYDNSGNIIWAKKAGGTSYDIASDVSLGPNESLYLTGGMGSPNISFDSINLTNTGYGDVYIAKLSDNCTLSIPTMIAITGGTAKVCPGDTRTYTTAQTTGVSYSWTVPTGAIINSGQGSNSINVTYNNSLADSGLISVIAINYCGSSFARNLTVYKNIPEMPISISGRISACPGDTNIYATKLESGFSYNWTVPVGAIILNGQGTNTVTVNFNNNMLSSGVISLNKVNSCGISLPRNLNIYKTFVPTPGAVIITGGSSKICPGESRTFTIQSPASVGKTYFWTVPTGATITNGQGTNSIDVDFDVNFSTNGIVSVVRISKCGTSGARNIKVYRNLARPGTPSHFSGDNRVCQGETKIYSVDPDPSVVFEWWVSNNLMVINSGQGTNSISVTYHANLVNFDQGSDGWIGVRKINNCNSGFYKGFYIFLNDPPVIPSNISGPAFGLCGGRDVVYSVQQVQGMIYNWTVPGLANITSGQGTNSITVNFQSVNFQKIITVTATNGCGTSAVRSLTIRSAPEKPGIISGPLSVCANSTGNTYSILPDTSATDYTWTGPTGSLISANGITSTNNVLTTTAYSVSVDFGNITSTSSVRVRANNTCGSGAHSNLLLTPCSPRMEETIIGFNASVYPNPTNGLITLVLNPESETKIAITVNDVLGKVVMNENLTLNAGYIEHQMNLQPLNDGLYFLTLQSAQGKQVIKITKE